MTSAYKQLQTKCDGWNVLYSVGGEGEVEGGWLGGGYEGGGRIIGRKEGGWDIICNTSMSYAVTDGNDHSLKLL